MPPEVRRDGIPWLESQQQWIKATQGTATPPSESSLTIATAATPFGITAALPHCHGTAVDAVLKYWSPSGATSPSRTIAIPNENVNDAAAEAVSVAANKSADEKSVFTDQTKDDIMNMQSEPIRVSDTCRYGEAAHRNPLAPNSNSERRTQLDSALIITKRHCNPRNSRCEKCGGQGIVLFCRYTSFLYKEYQCRGCQFVWKQLRGDSAGARPVCTCMQPDCYECFSFL